VNSVTGFSPSGATYVTCSQVQLSNSLSSGLIETKRHHLAVTLFALGPQKHDLKVLSKVRNLSVKKLCLASACTEDLGGGCHPKGCPSDSLLCTFMTYVPGLGEHR